MIAQVLRLTRWELFKVRKRWMPWILLAVAIVVVQATLWGFYSSYGGLYEPEIIVYHGPQDAEGFWSSVIRLSCVDVDDAKIESAMERVLKEERESVLAEIEDGRESCPGGLRWVAEEQQRHREVFVLPGSLANGLGVAHYIGVLLVMILGASVVGTEYGWGTLRTALTRGTERWQFLGAKALSLVLLSVAGLIVVLLTVVVSSLIAASLTLDDGGWLSDTSQWSTAAVMFGKAVYGLLPYAILTLFLTVLTSSSSMGIALSAAYYFFDLILVRILGGLFDWFNNVSDFLLGTNAAAWMTETGVETTGGNAALFDISSPPGALRAFLILLAYVVVLGGTAFWLFQRKDVTGARGE